MTMSGSMGAMLPAVGARVMTADGDEIGKVKEVSATCFKVDASMRPDYWLGSDAIASTMGDTVRLTVAKDKLGDAKVDGPAHSGVHPHDSGPTVV